MAIAHSPTSRSSERPSGATGSPVALILSTARSFVSSTPTTFAGYDVPSRMATDTVLAPATTWALVTITPSALTTNPEPIPACVRCADRPPKSCSNGSAATR
jgi:hypothetical protein